jgi:hypothetical protein
MLKFHLPDYAWDIQQIEIGHYEFIGECFVEGIMYGFAVPELEERTKMIFNLH